MLLFVSLKLKMHHIDNVGTNQNFCGLDGEAKSYTALVFFNIAMTESLRDLTQSLFFFYFLLGLFIFEGVHQATRGTG